MVDYYPPAAFGHNRVAASIDTPLHAFLPAPHVDHLHPDWAIALAASANGRQKLEEFNRRFGRRIIWVPWQRPGFELALLIESAVRDNPGADGLILGSHGLFTWGTTQRECYLNSIRTIDQMGAFIDEHRAGNGRGVRRALPTQPLERQARCGRAHSAGASRNGVVEPARHRTFHGCRRGADVRRLALGRSAEPPRHELPRSLSSHAHLPVLRRVGSRGGHDRHAEEPPSARKSATTATSIAGTTSRSPHPIRRAARLEPVGRHHSRRGALRVRQKQEGSADHDRVLHQRHQRHGRRHGAGDADGHGRSTAAGAQRRSRPHNSSSSTTTSRCRAPKRSASNIGRSKKPSCSACPLRPSSAARSCWSSAAAAASAARWRCSSRARARTLSSPTPAPRAQRTWPRKRRRCRRRNSWRPLRSI